MLDTSTGGTKASSLRIALLKGERPDAAIIDDVSEMLAMSPGGVTDAGRATLIHKNLSQYVRDGLLNLVDSGLTRVHLNTFAIQTFGSPGSSSKPFASSQKLLVLSWQELQKVRHMLIADALWSDWGDMWCGSSVEKSDTAENNAHSADTRLPLKVFKQRIEGKFSGDINSIIKHRAGTDRPQPYKDAFNDGKTVNLVIFKAIAVGQGQWKKEWDAEDSAASLGDAMKRMTRIV